MDNPLKRHAGLSITIFMVLLFCFTRLGFVLEYAGASMWLVVLFCFGAYIFVGRYPDCGFGRFRVGAFQRLILVFSITLGVIAWATDGDRYTTAAKGEDGRIGAAQVQRVDRFLANIQESPASSSAVLRSVSRDDLERLKERIPVQVEEELQRGKVERIALEKREKEEAARRREERGNNPILLIIGFIGWTLGLAD